MRKQPPPILQRSRAAAHTGLRSFVPLAPVFIGFLVLIGLGAGCIGGGGIMVSIYFDDAKLLKEKDPVVQDEMLIGRVESINLLRDGRIEVSARIMKQYIPRTRARSTAYISSGAEGNAYQLTLYALDSEGGVLDSGYRIQGANSWAALQIKRAAAKGRELGRDLTRDR